ncbi:MAG: HEAT repeat domain-containing protein [Gemmatimonas sp.]
MSPPSLHARKTPSAGTPESGVIRVASEGRASRSVARALGLLVERLLASGVDHDGVVGGFVGTDPSSPALSAVREALRQLSARSRDGAMLCRVVDGMMVLEGVLIDRQATVEDRWLGALLRTLTALNVGSITIREGAAPGELLTLGRLLAQGTTGQHPAAGGGARSAPHGASAVGHDTPTTVHAVSFADETPRELLRTWSVLVTPVVPLRAAASAGVTAGGALAKLAAARTDDAATSAVAALREVLDDAQRQGDAPAIEGIARACLTQLQAVGESGGRLAVEGAIRHLLSAPFLDLLAGQLPYSTDRALLLQLFARAGDAGVGILVQHLLSTDDALSRRAYFDGIVAMDVGAAELFTALHDSRWFVVRNAAALLGEMGVEQADDSLIPLLKHADERIRIAASRALMRLRTVKALQALQSVIDDPNAEVRRLSAAAFGLSGASGGAGVRPPAARLSAALEHEFDEDVALEMLAALGKLGSADAVQRLLRIALPATTDLTGAAVGEARESWIRIAALEALIRARGNQMQPVIDSLKHDADAEVAAAAMSMQVTTAP